MKVQEEWRIQNFIRAAKAEHGGPSIIIQIPVAMADLNHYPGADRCQLASVYRYAGHEALIVPASRRCGILVVKWELLMAWMRRRRTPNARNT